MGVEYKGVVELSRRLELMGKIAPKTVDDFLVQQIAKPAVEEMRAEAPVKSGKLRDSLDYQHPTQHKIIIGSFGVEYAKFVAEGTKPHVIRPKNASALKFQIGGRTVFAKSVKHPGTKANPFMSDAIDKTMKKALPRLAGVLMGPLKESR